MFVKTANVVEYSDFPGHDRFINNGLYGGKWTKEVVYKMNKKRRGFTLIELLVVIAIIAILAAILFPVFTSAKENGRKTACLNNMVQLGRGFMLYVDNWNRYPGTAPVDPVPTLKSSQWVGQVDKRPSHRMDPKSGAIYPYVKNERVYVCPSDKGGYTATYRLVFIKPGFGPLGFRLSYSMNSQIGYITGSDILLPSRTVLLVDESGGSYDASIGSFNKNRVPDAICDGNFGYGVDKPADSHCGGCNFSFCDGHVAWKDSKSYKNLQWNIK